MIKTALPVSINLKKFSIIQNSSSAKDPLEFDRDFNYFV